MELSIENIEEILWSWDISLKKANLIANELKDEEQAKIKRKERKEEEKDLAKDVKDWDNLLNKKKKEATQNGNNKPPIQ